MTIITWDNSVIPVLGYITLMAFHFFFLFNTVNNKFIEYSYVY